MVAGQQSTLSELVPRAEVIYLRDRIHNSIHRTYSLLGMAWAIEIAQQGQRKGSRGVQIVICRGVEYYVRRPRRLDSNSGRPHSVSP